MPPNHQNIPTNVSLFSSVPRTQDNALFPNLHAFYEAALQAGFYEAALIACLMIAIIIVLLERVEEFIIKHSRNMNLLVRFENLEDVSRVIEKIRAGNNTVYDVEMDKGKESECPSAIFSIHLAKRVSHASVIMSIAGVDSVRSIVEL